MTEVLRLRDRVVRFRVLIGAILGWGLLRLVVVLLAPDEVSVFAPDEAAYTGIVEFVHAGGSGQRIRMATVLPSGLRAERCWCQVLG